MRIEPKRHTNIWQWATLSVFQIWIAMAGLAIQAEMRAFRDQSEEGVKELSVKLCQFQTEKKLVVSIGNTVKSMAHL